MKMAGPIIQDGLGRDRLWPFKNPSNNSHLKRLETAFRASLGLDGRLKDHRASLDSTRPFTPAGLDAEVHKFVRNEVLPGVVKGHIALERARRHVKQSWDQLKPKAPDRQDLVGFFQRESVRDELRSLAPEQRNVIRPAILALTQVWCSADYSAPISLA
jgi:hypothetical protein